jgi:hypothetical protein
MRETTSLPTHLFFNFYRVKYLKAKHPKTTRTEVQNESSNFFLFFLVTFFIFYIKVDSLTETSNLNNSDRVAIILPPLGGKCSGRHPR